MIAALGVASLVLAACGDGAVGVWGTPDLRVGTWGAEGAGVIVTDSGVHVHIGCTYGDIPGIPDLDEDGRFAADGSFQPRAYPVESGPTVPAQFSGRVVGRRLTLAVAVDDTILGEISVRGPVTVEFGREPELGMCPICRIPGQRMTAVAPPPESGPRASRWRFPLRSPRSWVR